MASDLMPHFIALNYLVNKESIYLRARLSFVYKGVVSFGTSYSSNAGKGGLAESILINQVNESDIKAREEWPLLF